MKPLQTVYSEENSFREFTLKTLNDDFIGISMFSTGKMCKFSRTLHNRQLIQFARIPVEFVVRFIRYQNRVKVITFSIAA